MNILYLTQFLSPAGGGGEVVFYNLAQGMIKLGHHVDIICHQMADSNANIVDGATMHKIKPTIESRGGHLLSISQQMRYLINATVKGAQIITRKGVDIIHANTLGPVIPGSILGKIFKIPVVISVHDVYTTNSPNFWQTWSSQENVSRISSIVGPIYEKIILRMPVDIIHTVSNTTRDDIISFNSKSKIAIIPNGIDLDPYANVNLDKDYQKYVIFIGRLIITKNLEVVITAFKEVADNIPDVKLVIIGDGPMRKKWENLVLEMCLSKNIYFTGYVSQEKKKEFLMKCSALLFPSLVEGFGLVLLEAFAAHKPVIVADVKPLDEIVNEGIDGFVVPAHDSHKWAEKIIFVLSNRSVCESMGLNGRLKVESKYSAYNITREMEQLYIQLSSQ